MAIVVEMFTITLNPTAKRNQKSLPINDDIVEELENVGNIDDLIIKFLFSHSALACY